MFDYETLKLIWWAFVGVLIIGFALMDGFDFGVGMLLPFVAKTDMERRIVINSIGPTWEGNQTWFIAAGGALFAAWPLAYAAAFSGFYVALMLLLFSLFFRPVGFDYRSKVQDPRWRSAWDWALFVGGFVPPLIFGIAFGNLLLGVPFHYDASMRLEYVGGILGLLNPFGLLAGILSVAMLLMHGAAFLRSKTEGVVRDRAKPILLAAAITTVCSFVIAGIWVAFGIDGYRIISMPDANTSFMPVMKTVERASGAWLSNYSSAPILWCLPAIGLLTTIFSPVFAYKNRDVVAFLCSGVAVAMVILTAGVSMFPFVMPSSLHPSSSLTAWDVVASHKSLGVMFWVVVIFLPLIMAYTAWIYRVLRGKIGEAHISANEHSAY
ncbi:cytochrome d ubiquinol oxidase subunit II [Undibacterium sp. TS12]|uniref:cytochrome d ubiquinol oxidase subunit II n=1 Tax=Undibacterium sp. TS12 TaxID=2908202 RepID=UPI001F4D096E|nr:cytochrome d ubiquinol oxidase subunit II [Undibacterium sp. TS12]MCH8618454.1 cytochrome d ubiquinol oxidase subunit II [Undibacterium sp. TS12]